MSLGTQDTGGTNFIDPTTGSLRPNDCEVDRIRLFYQIVSSPYTPETKVISRILPLRNYAPVNTFNELNLYPSDTPFPPPSNANKTFNLSAWEFIYEWNVLNGTGKQVNSFFDTTPDVLECKRAQDTQQTAEDPNAYECLISKLYDGTTYRFQAQMLCTPPIRSLDSWRWINLEPMVPPPGNPQAAPYQRIGGGPFDTNQIQKFTSNPDYITQGISSTTTVQNLGWFDSVTVRVLPPVKTPVSIPSAAQGTY